MKKNRTVIPAGFITVRYIFMVPGCAFTGDFTREGAASTPPTGEPGYTVYLRRDAGNRYLITVVAAEDNPATKEVFHLNLSEE